MSSFRGRVNLHLMLARKFLGLSQRSELGEEWGGHYSQVMLETALFRLLQAYRCHLGDLLETRNIVGPCPADARQAITALPEGTVVPELEELVDREQLEPWLTHMLDYDFGGDASAHPVLGQNPNVLAVSSETDFMLVPDRLEQADAELSALINRHRDTVQEY